MKIRCSRCGEETDDSDRKASNAWSMLYVMRYDNTLLLEEARAKLCSQCSAGFVKYMSLAEERDADK